MHRFSFAVVAAAVVSAVLVQPLAAHDDDASPVEVDPAVIEAIDTQVSALRGIEPVAPVPVKVISTEDLGRHLEERANALVATVPPDLVLGARYAQQLLNFTSRPVVPTVSVPSPGPLSAALGIAGLFIPDEQTVYVVSNDGAFGDFQADVLAHEFTHALQSQRFNSPALEQATSGNPDRQAAYRAVQEGDATFTEARWAELNLDSAEVERFGAGWEEAAAERVGLYPYAYQTQTQFLYGSGTRLVREAFERAGGDPAGVNVLFDDPPVSTAQVLHPEKYWAHEMPAEVVLPEPDRLAGGHWRTLVQSTYGELGLQLLLQASSPPQTAAAVVRDWRGDRVAVLDHDGQPAMLFRSTWTSPVTARQFFDAFAFRLRHQFVYGHIDSATPVRFAVDAPGEAADLRLANSDVLLVLGVDRASDDALVAAVGDS